jgi:hypothetical protein
MSLLLSIYIWSYAKGYQVSVSSFQSYQTVGPVDNRLPPDKKKTFDVIPLLSLSILIHIRPYANGYHLFLSSSWRHRRRAYKRHSCR